VWPPQNTSLLFYTQDDSTVYRCTVFSHYARANSPAEDVRLPTLRRADKSIQVDGDNEALPGPYWSLMFEVSENKEHKPVNLDTIIEETIQGAINTSMVTSADEIVSIYYRRLEYGYPTPSLERDNVLNEAIPFLQKQDIWSRGRFGSYKYEVANQDHSMAIGVEAADNIMYGTKEFTLHFPSLTNEGGAKNKDLVYGPRK
jgi:hypothetical protein